MFIIRRNILLLFILSAICSAGEDHTRTDKDVMLRICDSLMSSVSDDVKSFPNISLSSWNDSAAAYLQPYLVQGLIKRNIPVFLKTDSTRATLELHVLGSSVFYGEVFTESFFGERKCERTVSMTMLGTVSTNADGKVLFSHSYSVSLTDTVAYSSVEQLSASAVPSAQYKMPQLSLFDSVLEPAIVTVASGIIIYLFFTIRS